VSGVNSGVISQIDKMPGKNYSTGWVIMTDRQSEIAAFYDACLPYFSRDHTRANDRHIRIKVKLAQIVKAGMSILDLGCGTGITSQFMGQLGAKVTAVDISPKLIEFAKKESAHKNVKYRVGDITEVKYRDNRGLPYIFDGVVLVDVFEHIQREEINNAMLAIDRCSGDRTFIVLNIPDGRYQKQAQVHLKERLQIVDEAYSIEEILLLFASIGFSPVDINIYGINIACQYNTFIFNRTSEIERTHREFMAGTK